jgi:pilus assembly protein CpaD
MRTIWTLITARRGSAAVVLRAAIVAVYGILVCGCQTDQQQIAGVPDAPFDYRQRHPITVTEAEHTMQLFIGSNRASLTPSQRAQVLAFAQSWKAEATGGVLIDLPAGTVNEQTSAGALHEIQSILAASGVPPNGMMVRTYQAGQRSFATVRIAYPKITAQAGPCGLWPQDIGPSATVRHFENQQDWNFGCSAQRNLAAMVENPEDLVQPRAETPAYTARRTQVVDKYRQGQPTETQYPASSSVKITDFGQ